MARFALVFVLSLCAPALLLASDADPLQDICVADTSSKIFVNGFVCKDPSLATADDFASSFIAKPGNTSNPLGSAVTLANVAKFPGINTLGISYARIDYAPKGGLNPPHVHPRASELVYVETGSLYVGFVTTENKLFATNVSKGDIFIFPRGLIHFQLNIGEEPAVIIAALTSQNPGTSQVAKATFASNPGINDAVLEKAFQLSESEVEHLKQVIKNT